MDTSTTTSQITEGQTDYASAEAAQLAAVIARLRKRLAACEKAWETVQPCTDGALEVWNRLQHVQAHLDTAVAIQKWCDGLGDGDPAGDGSDRSAKSINAACDARSAFLRKTR